MARNEGLKIESKESLPPIGRGGKRYPGIAGKVEYERIDTDEGSLVFSQPLVVEIVFEDGLFVAYALDSDVFAAGSTKLEALDRLKVSLLFAYVDYVDVADASLGPKAMRIREKLGKIATLA